MCYARSCGIFSIHRYNDHHFHYGYILYACAIMGRLNSTFVSHYGPQVDALMYDVAHDSHSGSSDTSGDVSFFPLVRHKSWYDGHSFASGLFPYGDGKSQESSSEAVNCYYGAYLWSTVRWGQSHADYGDAGGDGDGGSGEDYGRHQADFTRLLLAMEVRGAKTYWHMMPPSARAEGGTGDGGSASALSVPSVYNAEFEENYMVGVVGMMDVTCSTWFGSQSLYVHMINFMPVTGVTADLFDKDYVEAEYNNIIAPIFPSIEMSWKGYAVSDHAIIDPNVAWNDALELISSQLDSGLSLSQVLYWISTREGFNQTSSPLAESASCHKHSGCASLGLPGLCCPTEAGVRLGCCGEQSAGGTSELQPSTNEELPSLNSSTTASCDDNPVCASQELHGLCCPTAVGLMLGCCGEQNVVPTTTPLTPLIEPISPNTPGNTSRPLPFSSEDISSPTSSSNSSCQENSVCAIQELKGLCCPTAEGLMLGCCGEQNIVPSPTPLTPIIKHTSPSSAGNTSGLLPSSSEDIPSSDSSSTASSCEENPGCASLELQGQCCPTAGGVLLGCC